MKNQVVSTGPDLVDLIWKILIGQLDTAVFLLCYTQFIIAGVLMEESQAIAYSIR